MKIECHKLAPLPLFPGIREEDLSAILTCMGSFQKIIYRDEIHPRELNLGDILCLFGSNNRTPLCGIMQRGVSAAIILYCHQG